MKKILISILEISIGILFIVLIIGVIKYRVNILEYIRNQDTTTTSNHVINQNPDTNSASSEKEVDSSQVNNAESQADVQEEKSEEEPSEEEPSQEPKKEMKTANLVFTGDILLTGYLLSNYDNSGIQGIISSDLVDELNGADLTMVNEEFPFSNQGTAMEDKQFTFRIDPNRINVFKDLGIDIVTLANNHVLDYGQEALTDTFETLENAGIQYVGAGNNSEEAKQDREFEINGKKIGILAASRVIPVVSWAAGTSPGVFSTYDPSGLIEAIKEADSTCDTVIVYVHWGVERSEYPKEYQKELAKKYIDAGADVVIGSHPHVLQGIEYYNGKPIIYSLGNFIFGSQIPKTIMLKIEIGEDNSIKLAAQACATDSNYILNKASDQEKIYQYLSEISTNAFIDSEGNITQKE